MKYIVNLESNQVPYIEITTKLSPGRNISNYNVY